MADEEQSIVLQGTKLELMELIPQLMVFYQLIEAKDVGVINVLPIHERQKKERSVYRPRVTLHFQQDKVGNTKASDLETGDISFRLMDESSESISQAKINLLTSKIEQAFTTGNDFVWRKGKQHATYYDLEKGYQLQILCLSKAEAKDLVKAVLSIQNDIYLPKNLKMHLDEDESANYPSNPGTIKILGETVKKPEIRPTVNVRFTHATIKIWALRKPVILVDTRARASEQIKQ